MATSFTSWSALYTALLDRYTNALLTGAFETVKASIDTGNGSRSVEYRTLADLESAIERIKQKMDTESGDVCLRVYAKNGGRG